MPLYEKWVCLWPYMGTPQVFRVHKTVYSTKILHAYIAMWFIKVQMVSVFILFLSDGVIHKNKREG